jgi:hypothetical protein
MRAGPLGAVLRDVDCIHQRSRPVEDDAPLHAVGALGCCSVTLLWFKNDVGPVIYWGEARRSVALLGSRNGSRPATAPATGCSSLHFSQFPLQLWL